MRYLTLIALIVLFPLVAASQSRTAERVVTVAFSQLSTRDPNGSVRIVINGTPGRPCTAGTQNVLAIKLNGVWSCTDFSAEAVIGIAPADGSYITQTPNATLTDEQALSSLAVGVLKHSGSGVVGTAVAGVDYLSPTGDGSQLTGLLFSQLSGAITDAQVPNNITVDLAAIAGTANAGDSATAFFSTGTIEAARLPDLSGLNGAVTDAQVPNTITVDLATLATTATTATTANSGDSATAFFSTGIIEAARLGTGSGGSTRFLREDNTWQLVPGGGDALTANPLSQFASTTSAQLAGVLSNETGTNLAVFSDNPVLVTPTIANFVNAGHDHSSAAMGGQLTDAALSGVVGASKGGTGNAFFQVSGPATSIKTFTFPNTSATVLTNAAVVTIAQGGTGQTTATAAFNALDPLTAKGDVLAHDGTNSIRLAVGSNGLCLKADSAQTSGLAWGTCGSGTGDVVGPASATDNAIVRFDSTTGKLVQNSGVTIDDSNNLTTTGSVTTGSGGGAAGALELGEGTAPSLVANTFSMYAPADVAAGGLAYVLPAAGASGLLWATNSSGVMTITHDGASQTKTFTNTTLDVEATGNALTTVGFIEFVTAGANAGSAGPMLDVPASNGPAAAVIAGSNSLYGVLDFDEAIDESIQGSLVLPDDWAGNIDFFVDWQAAATTGNAVFALQTACVAVDETSDPAFNSAQTVIDAALGTANRRNVATITPVTMTGCTAGERLHFRFSRDADNASDTMSGDARVKSLLFKLRRTQ